MYVQYGYCVSTIAILRDYFIYKANCDFYFRQFFFTWSIFLINVLKYVVSAVHQNIFFCKVDHAFFTVVVHILRTFPLIFSLYTLLEKNLNKVYI